MALRRHRRHLCLSAGWIQTLQRLPSVCVGQGGAFRAGGPRFDIHISGIRDHFCPQPRPLPLFSRCLFQRRICREMIANTSLASTVIIWTALSDCRQTSRYSVLLLPKNIHDNGCLFWRSQPPNFLPRKIIWPKGHFEPRRVLSLASHVS